MSDKKKYICWNIYVCLASGKDNIWVEGECCYMGWEYFKLNLFTRIEYSTLKNESNVTSLHIRPPIAANIYGKCNYFFS